MARVQEKTRANWRFYSIMKAIEHDIIQDMFVVMLNDVQKAFDMNKEMIMDYVYGEIEDEDDDNN